MRGTWRCTQVLLDVAPDELTRRITTDLSADHGDAADDVRAWRLGRIAGYAAVRPSLAALVDRVIDTTALDVADVATDVLAAAGGPAA